MSFHKDLGNNSSFLAQHREEIDEIFFAKETVEEIVEALRRSKSKFGQTTLSTIQKMSPTSLKVTLEAMKRGKQLPDVGKCLQMEYHIQQRFMKKDSDFYEGIRALLIDKDHSPKWAPKVLQDINNIKVATFFDSLG